MQGEAPKHRILQLKCLFNSYNIVIPRPVEFGNILMLHMPKSALCRTIPTLRLEAMQGLSLETSNSAT